jgi:hypothetical protein
MVMTLNQPDVRRKKSQPAGPRLIFSHPRGRRIHDSIPVSSILFSRPLPSLPPPIPSSSSRRHRRRRGISRWCPPGGYLPGRVWRWPCEGTRRRPLARACGRSDARVAAAPVNSRRRVCSDSPRRKDLRQQLPWWGPMVARPVDLVAT